MRALKPLGLFEPDMPSAFRGLMAPMWFDSELAPPTIKVDVKENGDRYVVKADVPGVAKEDIRVDVDGGLVTIAAEVHREKTDEKEGKVLRSERYVGTMTRAFTLPTDVEIDKAEAKYADGVLTLTLPKHKGAASHRVTVN